MLNIAIVAGALAASPAIGGKALSDWLSATLGLSIQGWQLLSCAHLPPFAPSWLRRDSAAEISEP
jgi:hypothetical protein